MKTRIEVEALKRNWRDDPCWDIYETEGFEEYRDELVTFQTNMNQEWRAKEYNRIYSFAESLGLVNHSNSDEESLELAKYLDKLETRLETRIAGIEARLERNFHILAQ